MEIEIYNLVQECCDKEKKYRKSTYSCAKSESIFYLFAKKKDVNIFEELKVFDSLYENYKLKSLGWTKFLLVILQMKNFQDILLKKSIKIFIFETRF